MPSGGTAIAEFGAAKALTVNYATKSTVGALQFDASAPQYVFTIGTGDDLTLAAAGVVNLSTNVPTLNVSGELDFTNTATAANAALVANAGGSVDFSGVTSGKPTAGSIAGAGTYELGKNNLVVGSLGTSTTVNGSIRDGGKSGGTGGSLTKVGAGTLTLSGVNTYSGGTTVSAGTLEGGSGGLQGAIVNNASVVFDQAAAGVYSGAMSGSGAMTKIGSGTLTYTGVNTYTGSTTISAGTLQVSSGGKIAGTSGITLALGATGTGSGSASSGGSTTLYVSGAGSQVTTAGNILVGSVGAGTLTVDNGATVTANTVILGSSSSAGILNIGTGGTAGVLGSGTVVQATGANSVVNLDYTNATYTLAASLRNSLTLNQDGSGTTVLTGANTYTGGTDFNAGTLQVSSNANLGASTGALAFNGGTLQLSATIASLPRAITLNSGGGTIDTGAFSLVSTGAISGVGGLTKLGSGILTLNGVSSYTGGTTVSAGTLRGTTDSLKGNVVDNGNVSFLQTADGTYAGVMSGSGSLTKLDTANLTLTGTNTYTGATTVSSGTLTVNGSLRSPVTVSSSGTLAGVGTVNGAVSVLGTLSPGNAASPFGTLTVNGNLTLGSSAILNLSTDATGLNSRVNVIGAASLAGSVQVAAGSGTYAPSTRYTILTAANGVGMTSPMTVTTDMVFLTPTLSTDANDLYLTLVRNSTSLSSVAQTPNQHATAKYLQAISSGPGAGGGAPQTDEVLDNVLESNASQARRSFSQLGGSELTQLSRVSLGNTAQIMNVLSDRLSGWDAPGYRANEADMYAQAMGYAFADGMAPGAGLWVRGLGTRGQESSPAPASGAGVNSSVDWSGRGVALGFDTRVAGSVLAGASVSYTSSDVDLSSTDTSRGKVRSPQLMLYAGTATGALQLKGMLGYAYNVYESERNLTFSDQTTAATAEHDAQQWSAYAEAAYALQDWDGYRVEPLLGVRYIRTTEDAYSETGSVEALAVAASTTPSLTSNVGARLVRPFETSAGSIELRAIWSHEFADAPPRMVAHLASDLSGNSFAVNGVSPDHDTLQLGASVTMQLRRNLSAHFDYNAQMPTIGHTEQYLAAGASYVW